VHDQADSGDDKRHQSAQRIEQESSPGRSKTKLASGFPGEHHSQQQGSESKGSDYAKNADAHAVALQTGCGQMGCNGRDDRQQQDHYDKTVHQLIPLSDFGLRAIIFRAFRDDTNRAPETVALTAILVRRLRYFRAARPYLT